MDTGEGILLRGSVLAVALGVSGIVLAAGVLARSRPSGRDRRMVWRGATAVLLLLLTADAVGLTSALGARSAAWVEDMPSQARLRFRTEVPVPVRQHIAAQIRRQSAVEVRPASAAAVAVAARPHDSRLPWLGILWALGSALIVLRIGLAHVLIFGMSRRFDPIRSEKLGRRVRDLAQCLGVCRPVRVLESPSLTCPLVFGLGRPTLALPAWFERDLPPEQGDAVLLHELEHIRAGDARWRLLTDLVTAAIWWHPLAWWARSQAIEASESAADEASLALGDSGPIRMAEGLLCFGARLTGVRLAVLAARGGETASSLGRRVEALLALAPTPPETVVRRWSRRGSLLAMAVMGLVLMTGARPLLLGKEGSVASWKTSWRNSLACSAFLFLSSSPNPASAALAQGPGDDPSPRAAAAAPRVAPSPARQADKSEEAAAEAIGLSEKQRTAFDELLKERDERTKAFRERRPFDPDEGIALNTWWNGELKKLLTAEQYGNYVEYWTGSRTRTPAATSGAVAVAAPARLAGRV